MHLKKIHVSIIWYFIITSGKKAWNKHINGLLLGHGKQSIILIFLPGFMRRWFPLSCHWRWLRNFLLLFLFCLEIRLVLNLAMYSESKVDSIYLADFYMWQKKKKEESCKEKKRSERGYPNSNTFHLISAALPSVSWVSQAFTFENNASQDKKSIPLICPTDVLSNLEHGHLMQESTTLMWKCHC